MKDIQFRAKRIDTKEWITGFYYIGNGLYSILKETEIDIQYPIDKNTLCEYIGLYDRNGSRIFEWDIIRFYYDKFDSSKFVICIIKWDDELFKYKIVNEAGTCFDIRRNCEYEVIGNLYDDSSMLKGFLYTYYLKMRA